MSNTTQTAWLYCKDEDGSLWVINEEEKNVYKDVDSGRWRTRGRSGWIRVHDKTHKLLGSNPYEYYINQQLDLSAVPEPSWEDEHPIVVILSTVSQTNYYHYNE